MLGFFKFLYDKNFRVPVLLTNDTELDQSHLFRACCTKSK
jgi:hypothetical protein